MSTKAVEKKIVRKLKKFQHVVFKEIGIQCVENPTKNIVILNAGLVNGLSEEIIYRYFSTCGIIENIILVPGKSCSFVSYRDVNSAQTAFSSYNGKLNIAQDDKPIYLLYSETLPAVKTDKIWNELPPGLIILENFITPEEEIDLEKLCNFNTSVDLAQMKNRQVKHYGYEFLYGLNNIDKTKPMKEKIPMQCNFIWDRLEKIRNQPFQGDQLTINHYLPGQGIPHHIDTHSAFEDPILSLSLISPTVMEFKKGEKNVCVLLPARSLAIMSGESRYAWTHGITPRKFDIVCSKNGYTSLERGTRISFTFRRILQGECQCNFKKYCDSHKKDPNNAIMQDSTASELEKLYVHKVYKNIASHFSETRHKPWPNVLEFVQSFNTGSILVDIGCGNGKYLGLNQNSFNLGCDQSTELIDVCKERRFEVFTGNCLNVPIKDNMADGAISIAVIHHLATEERRIRAVHEMVRILKPGGRALIYVWAKNQLKDEKKSSYIKQDRKNRREIEKHEPSGENDQKVLVLNNVSLPVHTNRTQFKHNDLLVPWKLKNEDCESTFMRFYHVFQESELADLCKKINNIQVTKSYYDQGNWCVIVERNS